MKAWRVALQDGDRIEAVAQVLAVRGQPWLAVSDLHGRPDRLEALLAWMDARFSSWRLVLLGDYLDNSPHVPDLLDLVIALQAGRGDRVVAIAGNHDVVGIRALDTLGTPEGAFWSGRWSRGHWYPGLDTPSAYGATEGDIVALVDRMPDRHRAFLRCLPWYHGTGRYLFVHAGAAPGPLAPQISLLADRPAGPSLFSEEDRYGGPPRDVGLPPHLRGHEYATTADPDWDRVVVSAHHGRYERPFVEGQNRIALRATDMPGGEVMAVLLPDRTYLHALPGGVVEAVHIEEEVTP